MSELTAELNLVKGEDEDDTADYLTLGLASSLDIIDGLFNGTTGHSHSGAHQGAGLTGAAFADGSIPGTKLTDLTVTTQKLADGAVTAPKLGADLLEKVFAGSRTSTGANYTVVAASNVMWVFCTAGVTVTLTAGIERPVTVVAVSGNCTVVSSSGTVIGGSVDTGTGNVVNGRVNTGDALTYKWDSANWRAV